MTAGRQLPCKLGHLHPSVDDVRNCNASGILTGHPCDDGGWEIENDTGVLAWGRTKREAQAIVKHQRL